MHEIRDPIHGFIYFDDMERDIINSNPFQRLRRIKQLGMTEYVYPGANHTRFEHSLGVMEISTKIFDILSRGEKENEFCSLLNINTEHVSRYRRILRLAALLHDIGHAPFSHSPEDLFPTGYNHEKYTEEIIDSEDIKKIIEEDHYQKGIKAKDIIPIAVGPESGKIETPIDYILTEIITGELGADRIDYLLRDSLHLGVIYGKFDYHRLINTLRVFLLKGIDNNRKNGTSESPEENNIKTEQLEKIQIPEYGDPVLGIEEGGIYAAEGLILARYHMFYQVYYHDIRRVFDLHLQDFLSLFLEGGKFPANVGEFIILDDFIITQDMLNSIREGIDEKKEIAERILKRKHFKRIREISQKLFDDNPEILEDIYEGLSKEFSKENVKVDSPKEASNKFEKNPFYVINEDEKIENIYSCSDLIRDLKPIFVGRIYVEKKLEKEAKKKIDSILREGVRKE